MNNSQGASSFFSGLSTLLGRPHPLLHNLSDTTVTASVGLGAALRGEWYYDARTGFLVGGTKSTAVSLRGDGQVFTLTDSNLPDLGLR